MFMEFYFANNLRVNFYNPGYWAGEDPELDFEGAIIQNWTLRGRKCLFHVKSFLTLLFAIGHIDVWGAMVPLVPGQITVGGAHKTFSKDNWEYKTFWIILRGIDTEMVKSPCISM